MPRDFAKMPVQKSGDERRIVLKCGGDTTSRSLGSTADGVATVALLKERQLTKRVAVAELPGDVTIFRTGQVLDAPATDKLLIAWVTRHTQRGTPLGTFP